MSNADPDPDPAFHFDAYPDSTFYCNADPDPTYHFDAGPSMLIRNIGIQTIQSSR